jgi:hypothetical protein
MASNEFIARFQGKTSTMSKHGTFNVEGTPTVNKTSSPFQFTSQSIMRSSGEDKTNYAFQSMPSSGYNFFRPIKALAHSSSIQPQTEVLSTIPMPPSDSISTQPIPLQEPQVKLPPAARMSPKSDTAALRRSNYPPMPKKRRQSPASVQGTVESVTEKQLAPIKDSFSPYTLKDYKQIRPSKYYILGGLGAVNIGSEEWKAKKSLYDKRTDFARKLQRLHAEQILPTSRKPTAESMSQEVSSRQRALEFAKLIKRPPLKLPAEMRESAAPSRQTELQALQARHEDLESVVSAIRHHVNY